MILTKHKKKNSNFTKEYPSRQHLSNLRNFVKQYFDYIMLKTKRDTQILSSG